MSTGRVLIVSNHATIIGGGEISMMTLVKGLTGSRWRPLVAVPGPGEVAERCRALGVPVFESPLPSIRRPGTTMVAAAHALRRRVSDLAPDLVHANGSRATFYAGLATLLSHRRTIWHIRVLDPDMPLDAMLVRLADATIANSGATRERLRRWPGVHESCRVIPNGVDLEAFAVGKSAADVRAELQLDPDAAVLTCVSRLIDFKRQDLLLEAVARLRPRHPRLRCLLVGSGPEERSLRDRARQADLEGAVLFTGHRRDVADLLFASDAFVLPSPAEHFGRVLIEAMAAGLPVIAANACGPTEIVTEECGILFEPNNIDALADAIERLLADADLRRRMGAAGRTRVVERYSMEAHTRQVVALYDELCNSSGPAVRAGPPDRRERPEETAGRQ